MGGCLNGFIAGLAGADFSGRTDFVGENFSVSHFSGISGFTDRVNHFLFPFFGGYDDLEFNLGMHLYLHVQPAYDFLIAPLDPVSHNLRYGDAIHFYACEGFFDLFKFFFSDNCFYLN